MPENLTPFSYLTAPNVELYRPVMTAFAHAKRRFVVHLRPEDVHAALADGAATTLDAVTGALDQLCEWGNLRADPDTSRVTTVEDFHRARFLYQVTERGEAVEEAVAAYDEALGRRGALQAVALTDIATQLRALIELSLQPDPDPAKVHLTLRGLVDRFTDLADNAQAFMSSLQRTIDLHDADADTFLAYKDQLIAYLERFLKDLVGTGAEIASLIGRLEEQPVARLLDAAARREAADAAPGTDEHDDPRQEAFARGRVVWHHRWQGFREWFIGDHDHPSQAKLLRARARAAVPQLLQVVAAQHERRTGRSDRSADFRSLARWFALAPDDAARHRLWRAASGLSSARHMTTGAEQLDEPVAPDTPWAKAPPLTISPRLRRTGSYERRGKPNRIVDRTAERQYLRQMAAEEAEQTAAAKAALTTTHPTRLSALGWLDTGAFGLFLTLLGDALSAKTPGAGTVETTTSDGTLTIRLTTVDDGGLAIIETSHGVLRGPDHLVEIIDLAAAPIQEQSA